MARALYRTLRKSEKIYPCSTLKVKGLYDSWGGSCSLPHPSRSKGVLFTFAQICSIGVTKEYSFFRLYSCDEVNPGVTTHNQKANGLWLLGPLLEPLLTC